MTTISFVYFVLIAAVAFSAGYFMRKSLAEAKIGSAEEAASRIIQDAERDAEAKYREKMLELRRTHKPELRLNKNSRRTELQEQDSTVAQKEDPLTGAPRI